MDTLILLLTFLAYLAIQALAINGIYISAQGRTDILPDGTSANSEMILYPIYKFLNQNYQKNIYFTLAVIKQRTTGFPVVTGAIIDWTTAGPQFRLSLLPGTPLNLSTLDTWAQTYLNGKVEYDPFTQMVSIYQSITFYKFSKYIRKPIITCIICMASFWSIFLFLIPVIFILGWNIKIIPIWIVNVLCLSYLNYVIFKPRK